ncbi:Invertase/pectin methylesterase inhibitor domain superfamily [Sesbania bispinosa]|nr:Invertase/pectin methylesterase inhibitor domain superfamily [Sesbania bispinosa]
MDYTDVLLCLSQAQQSYTTEDYNAMNSKGATVIKDLQDCDSKAPTDPSPLMKNNQDLEDVSMIIMILADFLAGKY